MVRPIVIIKNTVLDGSPLSPHWQFEHDGVPLIGMGTQSLLALPLTAFFASRRCPGVAIRAGTDWALARAHAKQAVVSGFHSPLEQSALKLLLQAKSPVVVVARPLEGARLDRGWLTAIEEGRMAVVSSHTAKGRLSEMLAVERNDVVALLASRIVIAHAEPSGRLDAAVIRWKQAGLEVEAL